MNPLLSDPWIAAQIDAAVSPYAGVLAEEQLAWMREQLAETLATDNDAARLLRRAHPQPVDESGEVGCEVGAPAPHVAADDRAPVPNRDEAG